MTEPPEHPGSRWTVDPALDPEDAPVELDEHGFLMRDLSRWQ